MLTFNWFLDFCKNKILITKVTKRHTKMYSNVEILKQYLISTLGCSEEAYSAICDNLMAETHKGKEECVFTAHKTP